MRVNIPQILSADQFASFHSDANCRSGVRTRHPEVLRGGRPDSSEYLGMTEMPA
jgi:hypothetical protein